MPAIWRPQPARGLAERDLQEPAPTRPEIIHRAHTSPDGMPLASTSLHPHTMQLETNPGPATKPAARLDHATVPSPIRDQDAVRAEMPTWSRPRPLSRLSPSLICTCTLMARCPCPCRVRRAGIPFTMSIPPSTPQNTLPRAKHTQVLFPPPLAACPLLTLFASPTSRSPPSLSPSSLFGILHRALILAPRGMGRIAFDSQV